MAKRTTKITSRLTPKELDLIKAKASDHGLSVSSYIRNISMNYPTRCIVDQKAIGDILEVAADMGRLGGLFKHWLVRNEDNKPDLSKEHSYEDIESLVEQIIATQILLKERARELIFRA